MSETLKLVAGMPYHFDTAIIANGGDANSALWLQKIDARQIIVLEPDAKAYSKLEKQISGLNLTNVQLQQKALVPKEQNKIPFFTASASEFSSVCEPQKIKKLRPGVSFESTEVDAVCFSALFDELKLDSSKANLFVLNANGPELAIVKQLNIKIFNCVVVRTSNQHLYGESDNLTLLNNYYREQDIPKINLPESAPPFVNLVTVQSINWHETAQKVKEQDAHKQLSSQLNSAQKSNKALQDENQSLRSQVASASEQLNILSTESVTLSKKLASTEQKTLLNKQQTAEQAQLNNQLQEELLIVSKESEKSQTSLDALQNEITQILESNSQSIQEKTQQLDSLNAQVSEFETLIDKSNADINNHVNKNGELNQQIENLNQAGVEKANRINSLKTKVDELIAQENTTRQTLEDCQKQLKYEAHWHQENKKRAESLNKQNEEMNQKVYERQKASDLALKLMTKSQVDLDDLRKKYQTKHDNEQKLVELIKELRQKLKEAAEFYHYLQEHYPELEELSTDAITVTHVKDKEIAKIPRKNNQNKAKQAKSDGKDD
jgi:FkbM family methyltransferase